MLYLVDFARTRGAKDKGKRKTRTGLVAGASILGSSLYGGGSEYLIKRNQLNTTRGQKIVEDTLQRAKIPISDTNVKNTKKAVLKLAGEIGLIKGGILGSLGVGTVLGLKALHTRTKNKRKLRLY